MSNPTASIIIRCYNEQEHIGKLLSGIFAQRFHDFETILIDSGSTDGTVEIAQTFPIDDILYLDPNEFSFGRALNYGCRRATGKYCIFASAHVYPRRKDWLDKMLEKFDDSDIALVYGKQRGNEITKYPEHRIFRRWFPDHDRVRQESPFCNNANAAIRRHVWEDFRYDEKLTGLEGLDWAKRVQEAGYDITYASDAEIIHVHDEIPAEVYNRYRREAIALKRIFPERDFTLMDFISTFTRNVISDYRAALSEGELLNALVEIPRFRFMQFSGTYRGFSQETPVSDRLLQRFYYPDTDNYPEPDRKMDETSEDDNLEIDYSTER